MQQTRWNSLTLLLAMAASLFISACGGGGGNSAAAPAPLPPPPAYNYAPPADTGDTWTIGDAADNGLDIGILENMMNDIRAGQFSFIDAVVIAKDGVLVFEETIRTTTDSRDAWANNTNPAMHAQFSVSKSITSLVVGIAIDEGYISGIDTPYLGLFSYPSYDNWDVRKDDITLEHVLSMRAGLDWDEWDPPYSSPDNQWNRFIAEETDFSKAYLDLPLVEDPGSIFAYSTAASASLGQAVENRVPMALIDFGLSELMTPLGIGDIEVLTTPTGLPNGGSGFYLRARDTAKFGQLLVNGGTWNNEQIISQAWLDDAVTPRTDLAWTDPTVWDWQLEGYGLQWWTGYYDHNGAQYDAKIAWGYGGQWIIAIPQLELVIAINSHAYDAGDAATNEGHALVRNYILEALNISN